MRMTPFGDSSLTLYKKPWRAAPFNAKAATLNVTACHSTDRRIMVTSQFPAVAPQKPRFRENLTVWFPDAQCDLVISQPALDPTLWNEFLDGAIRTYSKHGVECTLDLDAIRNGSDTQLFLATVDSKGHV